MANTIVAFDSSFAAVHDSFCCHLSDMTLLQDITKMTFIAQYDVPNFFTLLEGEMMQHRDTFKTPQPRLGILDVNDVQNSSYFFC
jgi:DNA-directed RNA polymerase